MRNNDGKRLTPKECWSISLGFIIVLALIPVFGGLAQVPVAVAAVVMSLAVIMGAVYAANSTARWSLRGFGFFFFGAILCTLGYMAGLNLAETQVPNRTLTIGMLLSLVLLFFTIGGPPAQEEPPIV